MKLGMEVGLDPGHNVLDGDPAPPPQKEHSPQFSVHVCCGQMAGWTKMPLWYRTVIFYLISCCIYNTTIPTFYVYYTSQPVLAGTRS